MIIRQSGACRGEWNPKLAWHDMALKLHIHIWYAVNCKLGFRVQAFLSATDKESYEPNLELICLLEADWQK
jgi:hypothetical protein